MNAGKPDEIDLKILVVLKQNARMGVVRIGHIVGLTESPVTNRIEKLEQAGFIKGYTVLLDREKTSHPVLVILLVRLRETSTAYINRFEALIAEMAEVELCMLISGSWNFVLHVNAVTPQSYAVWLLNNILSEDFVGMVESAYLMRESKGL
jgi:DNA-binding Lrp family transcriptional regulator